MEPSTKIKLKITWLVALFDKSRQPNDPRYFKLLLDNEEPISITVDEIDEDSNHLIELNNKYIQYDHKFIAKHLAGFRVLSKNLCEVVYVSAIHYIPGVNKAGTIYSTQELDQRKIDIGSFYERSITTFGSGAYG